MYPRIYDMERISQLLYQYLRGTLSDAEHEELMAWVGAHPDNLRLLQQVVDGNNLDTELTDWFTIPKNTLANDSRLEIEISKHEQQTKIRRIRQWIPYAAAVMIMLTIGIWFLDTRHQTPDTRHQPLDKPLSMDIAPGSHRATLTLADGRTIGLSEAHTGIVVGDRVSYLDGSTVLGTGGDESKSPISEVSPLMAISTPVGGTYQVTLADGTTVWLNSASTLKYPSQFLGAERVVEISGEAYFSVSKDVKKPFKVISEGQEIQVLGTQFNISAYANESESKTTLVNGSVLILNSKSNTANRLKPGQQGIVREASTVVQQVDTGLYVAWKNGYFYFKHTPFEEVMRQLARWYNVELVYKGDIPRETFSGEMGRDLTLGAALKLLNISAVQVQIADGNKLIIY
jgi:transmembrane sensor